MTYYNPFHIYTYIQGIPVVSGVDIQNFSTTLVNSKAILNLNIYNICLFYLDFFANSATSLNYRL